MEEENLMQNENFEIRDLRDRDKFVVDDKFLNGYARFVGIYAVGVYNSLCRHANVEQKCWPSLGKIGEELSIGRNSVIEAIKNLEFWKIVIKKRIGKRTNNRYLLTRKTGWKIINETNLREYSVVCSANISSLLHKHHLFALQTSNSKVTNSKVTKERDSAETSSALPFSYKEEIEKLKTDKKRHIQFIGEYIEEKHIPIESKEQLQICIRRHLRSAVQLSKFSNERVGWATEKAEKEYPAYTLETLVKILTR